MPSEEQQQNDHNKRYKIYSNHDVVKKQFHSNLSLSPSSLMDSESLILKIQRIQNELSRLNFQTDRIYSQLLLDHIFNEPEMLLYPLFQYLVGDTTNNQTAAAVVEEYEFISYAVNSCLSTIRKLCLRVTCEGNDDNEDNEEEEEDTYEDLSTKDSSFHFMECYCQFIAYTCSPSQLNRLLLSCINICNVNAYFQFLIESLKDCYSAIATEHNGGNNNMFHQMLRNVLNMIPVQTIVDKWIVSNNNNEKNIPLTLFYALKLVKTVVKSHVQLLSDQHYSENKEEEEEEEEINVQRLLLSLVIQKESKRLLSYDIEQYGYMMKELCSLMRRMQQWNPHLTSHIILSHLFTTDSIRTSLLFRKLTTLEQVEETNLISTNPGIIQRRLWLLVISCLEYILNQSQSESNIPDSVHLVIESTKTYWKRMITTNDCSFQNYLFQMFGGHDSDLITALHSIFNIYQQMVKRRIGMKSELDSLLEVLSPFGAFYGLLVYIGFDYSILLDFLISRETINFLPYLIAVCKYMIQISGDEWQDSRRLQYRQVVQVLSSLCTEIDNLDKKDLFPYNPKPLLRVLRAVIAHS